MATIIKRMKFITNLYYLFLFTFLVFTTSNAQDAVHNYGNIQIHDDGLVGFHMDVVMILKLP